MDCGVLCWRILRSSCSRLVGSRGDLGRTSQRELAATYNADGSKVPSDAPKEIVVLDVLDQTATAKLTASWGVDYFHLAKYDGRWQIVHVLWQTLPK